MSTLLSSFRGHFFKQLVCTSFSSIHTPPILTHGSTFKLLGSTKHNPLRNLKDFLNLRSVSSTFCTASSAATETSKTGSYLSVDIQCHQDFADTFSEALLCFGAVSTSMVEPDSCNSNEVSIGSIFAVSHDVHQSIALAADSIGLKETPVFKVTTGYQSDWIDNARESFHPIEVMEGLWIVPEWITPTDIQGAIISLNPGLAFGTGDHPTTKLCMLLLHSLIKGGEKVLDYGTGSGILAIAALKFGAASSVGFDIDPQAISAARHNAALNNIGPEKLELQIVPCNINPMSTGQWHWAMKSDNVEEQDFNDLEIVAKREEYDVVIANILLNPLLDLADHIVSYAKPGAVVGLSGIILEQVPTVVDRYSDLLEGITVSEMGDWACINGTKRKMGS
uniref:ribosomal protein L11 methyltransferase isoform X2 n=1 Tax=Erigeron canadensis TaxID=72917 RepID=UPI001CB989DF|nr:ribosomal protein L11 methyltransferase isoform X2 [Erigeron canadensis]